MYIVRFELEVPTAENYESQTLTHPARNWNLKDAVVWILHFFNSCSSLVEHVIMLWVLTKQKRIDYVRLSFNLKVRLSKMNQSKVSLGKVIFGNIQIGQINMN